MLELDIRLESSDQLVVSRMIVEALRELYAMDWGPACPPIHPEYEAICAYGKRTGKLLGVITFKKFQSSIWIYIGYVRPENRRYGIYRRMWNELVKVAKDSEINRIEGSTHLNNTVMRAVYKSLGRKETFVTGCFEL